MFERFTETARRTIFFARYEASVFGSPVIEIHHLLLGALREDKTLSKRLPPETIRHALEQRFPRGASVSTVVDLPLSSDSKRALAYAAEEAQTLRHHNIDTPHLFLGILRVENSVAAELLQENGIDSSLVRGLIVEPPALPRLPSQAGKPAAPSLEEAIGRLNGLVENAERHLDQFSATDAGATLASGARSRREALGHLIDWATTHHQWFARALSEPRLTAHGYPADEWVSVQHYATYSWGALITLWVSMNHLMVHVLMNIPEEKVSVPCRIGVAESMPLSELIAGYVKHCEDMLVQILALG